MDKGLLIVLSGPSAAGKGTVCEALMLEMPDICLSVSCTTREIRKGEKDGVDYFYKTKEEFELLIKQGDFLEYASVYSNYYGTPKSYVDEKLSEGKDVILEIDVQGALNVKKIYPHGVYIFLVPPSMKELERRIRSRARETEEQLLGRLSKAKSEMGRMQEYDYVVVNDTVAKAVHRVKSIIEAERLKISRNLERYKFLLDGDAK